MAYDAGDYQCLAQEGDGDRRRQGLRQAQARDRRAHGKLRGLGYSTYIEACGIAPSPGGRLARRRRRLVGIGGSAGQPGRHRRGAHRLPRPRPGARDHLRAARLGSARHPDRPRLGGARRHRQGAVRHGHLRLALRRGRHVGDRQGARQGRGQGQEGRRPSAGGGRRRYRVQGRQVHRRRHRQVGGVRRGRARRLCRAQVPGRRDSSRA